MAAMTLDAFIEAIQVRLNLVKLRLKEVSATLWTPKTLVVIAALGVMMMLFREQLEDFFGPKRGWGKLLVKNLFLAPKPDTWSFLQTFELCGKCDWFERFGEHNDGGYLMCMDDIHEGQLTAALSLGVEHHDQWSEDVSNHFNIPVYQFDCTVDQPPEGCKTCQFFKKCLKSEDGLYDVFPNQSWSLTEAIEHTGLSNAADRTVLLKMDIEGAEWNIFSGMEKAALSKFQQIFVEFHTLQLENEHKLFHSAMKSLLDAGFHVTHLHGNNFVGMYRVAGYRIPEVLEVTFTAGARRKSCSTWQEFSKLDDPNTLIRDELPIAHVP